MLISLSSFSQGKVRIINSDTVIVLSFKDGKWINQRFKEMEDSLHQYKFKYNEKHADYDSLHQLQLQSELMKLDYEDQKQLNEKMKKWVKQDEHYRVASVAASWFTIIGLTLWFMVISAN